jgi:hypothetical protein
MVLPVPRAAILLKKMIPKHEPSFAICVAHNAKREPLCGEAARSVMRYSPYPSYHELTRLIMS